MKIKIFTLKFDNEKECFDDSHLCEFLAGKEVIGFREIYFEKGGESYWNILIHWKSTMDKDEKKFISPSVAEEDIALFEGLKQWRNNKGKALGLTPFLIMTNAELSKIASQRPATLHALGEIHGIGEKKLENYGQEILAIVAKYPKGKKNDGK
jgi:superfamily II DNA helicase RecQ